MAISESTAVVRDARSEDVVAIVEFNTRLALETEHKVLDPDVLRHGVVRALDDPERLRYWVAEVDGRVIGQTAATREWSDWRNGWLWWLQSVYVHQDYRGQGVFRSLNRHVRSAALSEADVIGLRLYVESENARAQEAYRSLGMIPGGYQVFEEIWSDRLQRAD